MTLLFGGKIFFDNALYPACRNYTGNAQRHAVYAVLTVQIAGNACDGRAIVENGIGDIAHASCNTVMGAPLSFYYLRTHAGNFFLYFLLDILVKGFIHRRTKLFDRYSGNVDLAPHCNLVIAVFTYNLRVNDARAQLQIFGDKIGMSSMHPVPKTSPSGKPINSLIFAVRISTGLVTTRITPEL